MWDLIVSVPDHCLSFYFTVIQIIHAIYVYSISVKSGAYSGCRFIETVLLIDKRQRKMVRYGLFGDSYIKRLYSYKWPG